MAKSATTTKGKRGGPAVELPAMFDVTESAGPVVQTRGSGAVSKATTFIRNLVQSMVADRSYTLQIKGDRQQAAVLRKIRAAARSIHNQGVRSVQDATSVSVSLTGKAPIQRPNRKS